MYHDSTELATDITFIGEGKKKELKPTYTNNVHIGRRLNPGPYDVITHDRRLPRQVNNRRWLTATRPLAVAQAHLQTIHDYHNYISQFYGF